MRTMNNPRIFGTRLAVLAALFAAPAAAQDAGRGGDPSLAARMEAFVDAAFAAEPETVAAFFPRRGDWTWVQTWREVGRAVRTGTWRFSAAETVRAIAPPGPACISFDVSGEYGPAEPALWTALGGSAADWRQVGGNRLVPRQASARSPVFVEWRREDGAWVVAAYGDAHPWTPRLLGREPGGISRDTALVPEGAAYAAGADWYVNNMPVSMDGFRYVKYAPPRVFPESDRQHLERIGVYGRVSVYREKPVTPGESTSEVLYVPVAPGEFQAYTGSGHMPCEGAKP
jgi:hypothetical protein